MLRNLKSAKGVGTHQKSTMLDFLLNSILTKTPNVANFALKLEGCQDAIKMDLTTVGDLIKNFQEQGEKVKDVIGEKKTSLDADRCQLEPLIMQDESGLLEDDSEDMKAIEKL